MSKLNELKPSMLWKNFEGLCSVPHPSKKEEKIQKFVADFGKKIGLETIIDEVGNVIIRKPATPGMENRKGIIIQGHLDMVPQKNSDTKHDFENDPIQPRIDGEWVKATGTTLGADNGIGVAAAMTILESKDLPHGPIECLFTTDEETGMTGAFGLKGGIFKGDILLNLDSEEEGELYIGCAGGINTSITFNYKEEKVPAGSIAFNVKVTGLKGGHSGMEINLGRGNANKIMNRILWQASRDFGLSLSKIEGGSLRNAIPRESFALVTIPAVNEDKFNNFIKMFADSVKKELATTEPDLKVLAEKTELPSTIIDPKVQANLFNSIYACPNGVYTMSADIEGLVETSTNLAQIKSENGKIQIETLQRGSVESLKDDVANAHNAVFTLAGAEVVHAGGYPGWKPNVNSEILILMKKLYNEMYHKEPEVKAVHAGLECGLLGKLYPNWDMISFGPTICSPHSPDERVNIASVGKFWDLLINVLKNAPKK
ncbi:MAG: aminoacyl-histidine dipeptidase [Bacteroidota bacterium]|nr:aminoacyl-histidine dipeptidase [Bacteroidota bacterium]